MRSFVRENFIIIIAFLLPLVLIGGLALSVYVPGTLMSPQYNFVYATCNIGVSDRNYFDCEEYLARHLSVVAGELQISEVVQPTPDIDPDRTDYRPTPPTYNVRLFLHDTEENRSQEITIERAQALTLNDLITDPNGLTVVHQYDRGPDFVLFSGGSAYGHYLVDGRALAKLNLVDTSRSWRNDNFHFIGWVVPGRN